MERFSQFTFIKSGLITGGEDFKVPGGMLRKVPDILIGTPGRMIEQLNAGNLDLEEVSAGAGRSRPQHARHGFCRRRTAPGGRVRQSPADHAVLRHHRCSTLRDMVAKVLNNPEHLHGSTTSAT